MKENNDLGDIITDYDENAQRKDLDNLEYITKLRDEVNKKVRFSVGTSMFGIATFLLPLVSKLNIMLYDGASFYEGPVDITRYGIMGTLAITTTLTINRAHYHLSNRTSIDDHITTLEKRAGIKNTRYAESQKPSAFTKIAAGGLIALAAYAGYGAMDMKGKELTKRLAEVAFIASVGASIYCMGKERKKN